LIVARYIFFAINKGGVWRLQNRTSNSHCEIGNDLLILAEEEMVLQGVTDKLNEFGRSYRLVMNVESIR
jgi:hypothetical protein